MRSFLPTTLLLLSLCVLPASPARAGCDLNGLPPGTEIAELSTPAGSFCIELLRNDAPLHVDNFLHYLDNEAMLGTFFHRTVPDFILQGGGFIVGVSDYEAIPATNGPVVNEPCTLDIPDPQNPGFQICSQRGNERGTVALAKLGGDPNSGTTNWFVNLVDNRSNLDNQNGGFTVFGRVIGDGMDVVDAVAVLSTPTEDDLGWMESPFLTAAEFPIPLLEPTLSNAEDAVGCWDPSLQTSALDDTQLPSIVGLGPDPSNPTILFHTLSSVCATEFLDDPTTFVGNPTPGIPGGCPFEIFTVRTTGPITMGWTANPTNHDTLLCDTRSTEITPTIPYSSKVAHCASIFVTILAS